jgi:hypothetical protein
MMHISPTVVELRKEPAAPEKKWQRVWVNGKLLAVAIAIELIIVGAVLFASYQFAQRYSDGDNMQWWMAIICGVSYAAVELARVPLAIVAATHRRRFIRLLSIFFLMFAVVITTKSLSQVGEQMFSQRLVEVNKARTALQIAEANNHGAIENDANKHDRIEALDAEIGSLLKQLKEFGKPPEPKQVCNTTQGRRGPIKICKIVTPPWAGATIQQQLLDARARRNAMDGETEAAGKQRDAATAAIAAAKGRYQVAVMDSQLHSFAGMLFMKSSSEVTDDEIAKIKLFFVFIGALAGAVTATGLAYCSFTRHPEPKKPKPVRTQPNVNIMPALRELANDLKLERAKANV